MDKAVYDNVNMTVFYLLQNHSDIADADVERLGRINTLGSIGLGALSEPLQDAVIYLDETLWEQRRDGIRTRQLESKN